MLIITFHFSKGFWMYIQLSREIIWGN